MKKPNITEGNWDFVENFPEKTPYGIDSNSEGYSVVEFGEDEHDSYGIKKLEDAQAISAAPDMIDALIDAREFILNQGPVEKYDFETLGVIEGALKKAGCE